MNFITKDIPLQRTTINNTTIISSSGGGSSSSSVQYKYLQLDPQSSNLIDNGAIALPTSLGGLYGSITGDTANYLISNNNGWIFRNSSTTNNVASISNDGELTVKTASITNGITRADLSINSNAELLIGGANVLVDGYIDVTELKLNNGVQKIDLSVGNDGALLLNCDLHVLGNIYSDKEVSAFGLGTGSGGSGGLINIVNSYANLGGVFSDNDLTNTFNSYTINQINNRLINVENGALTQISSALVTNALGFTPVQNGTGIDQTNNTVKIGWSNAGKVKVTIDSTNIGNILFEGKGNSLLTNDSNYLKYAPTAGEPQNVKFAIGENNNRNFIQSHSSQPLDLNPLGNAVTINGQSVWHTGNFSPNNYLPLTGGFLSGFLDSTDRIVTNNLFLTRNSAIGNQILLNATGANYGAIQTVNSNSWGLGTGGGGVDRNINNTALIWDINKNVTIGGNIKIGISLSDSPTSTPACFDSGRNYSNGKTKDKLKFKLYDEYGFTVGSDGDVQYHSNIQHQTYIDNNLKSTINSTGLHINGEIKTNGNSVIHSGNIASQLTNSNRLYSTDTVYAYGNGNAYFGYLTYNDAVNRWRFAVSPATPANVEVNYSDVAGNANNADNATTSNRLTVADVRGDDRQPAYFSSYRIQPFFSNTISGLDGHWKSGINVAGWDAGSYNSWQLIGGSTTASFGEWYFREGTSSFGTPKRIWHSGNVTPLDKSGGSMTGELNMGSSILYADTIAHTNARIILHGNMHFDSYNGFGIYNQYYSNADICNFGHTRNNGKDITGVGTLETTYANFYGTANFIKQTPVGTGYNQLGIQVYSTGGLPVGIGFHRSGHSQCILEHYDNGLTVRSDGQIGTGGLGNFNAATITGTLFNGSGAGLTGTASNLSVNYATTANKLNGSAHTNGTDGWWRSDGSCGWYNESYGVGIYATEAGNVRTYNGANFISSGNITANGEIAAYSSSDIRLKQNIQPLNKSLELINKLNPVQYNWNDKAKELNPNKTDKTDVGVIAQELEKVLPNLVHNIYNDEFLAVDYVKLIPYLIGAVQELTQEINTLKNNK